MMNRSVKVIGKAIALPVAVFLIGAVLLNVLSGYGYVSRRLQGAPPMDRIPLYMRVYGYDREAVARHWERLDGRAIEHERRFLQLDLLFPLFYGAALAYSLRKAWLAAGRPFPAVVAVLMVALTMIADGTENLAHLSQLQRFAELGRDGLQSGAIRLASAATIIKLLFFFGTLTLTARLALRTIPRSRAQSS